MPLAAVNGIQLHYKEFGSGDPVVLIQGTGGGHSVWLLHQVPDLTAAGYRVIVFDNRGIPPTSVCAEGFTIDDLAGDVAGLIEHLRLGPSHVVGTSMGSFVAQELALSRPDLVRSAVLMATRGRSDRLRAELTRAEIELHDAGITLPPRYAAVVRALKSLSPRTLDDERKVADWLELFEFSPGAGAGQRAQMEISKLRNRLPAYAGITVPCQVIAFADDLITPPHLGREVADAITGARYELIADCGHYGYLEDPESVGKCIVDFLAAVE
ncbi:alpha/beta fold hydrolase [Actinoplanes friuliensis]|jgi:pimeloyl-ACP methyl ester carboxylesterase|uniref:Hydrolase n=2 Tax=Actinoplanes friuliensis TaxID=196914 RepID=U5W1X8_9ACTN|nr:alpha/beta fold hydrolase [Actinoplanes friuliensis]AGZ41990.1 hydrolase [Actinoplanes friuliensis DSM 7358]CAM56773.1 LipE [Actinoplanes friuliensis]